MRTIFPFLLALPWLATPVIAMLRVRRSRSLDEESAEAPDDAPYVSIVIPARNEARNIVRCVESACAAHYPFFEVIVVDDHSTDGTGALAAAVTRHDAHVHVIVPAPLPLHWFGKQWACATGAVVARGEIIGFFDADTYQTPDLLPRVVNAMLSRGSDMLTVAGTQEMHTFWERILQPQVFAVLLSRYGGTEAVNDSRSATNKIANGQCLFVRREAYDAIGGHASVCDKVAEDLALAQRFFSLGHRTTMILGLRQLRTRMYSSLRELVAGWGKNIYAGGADAMPGGPVGRALFPLLLIIPWLMGLLPPIALVLSLAGMLGHSWLVWALVTTGANLAWWLGVYFSLGMPLYYALLHPLGSAMMLYISMRAIARGRRVEWKGREYVAG